MKHIFVSSTFKGMHSEREIVQKDIIPMLNEKAGEYGEYIEYVDLRWECNINDIKNYYVSDKTMNALREEISIMKPYMLIFQEECSKNEDLLFEEYEKCILCVKQTKKDELKELKEKFKDRLIVYTSMENIKELSKEISEKIINMFDETIKENSLFSWQEKEILGYRAYLNEINGFFNMINKSMISLDKLPTAFSMKLNIENVKQYEIGCYTVREKYLEKYYDMIITNSCKLFTFLGESGCGKSSMYAKLVHLFEFNKQNVFPFICGYSVRSITAEDLLKQMVSFLEDKLNIVNHFEEKKITKKDVIVDVDFIELDKEDEKKKLETKKEEEKNEKLDTIFNSFKDWKEYFGKLLVKYDEKYETSFIIMIDAVEQFSDNELEKVLDMIPFVEDNKVKCVMFGHESINFDIFREYEGITKTEKFLELTARELGGISEGILNSNGIKLDNIVIDSLLKKHGAKNPLYINLLMYYLVMECKEIGNVQERYHKNRYLMDLIDNQTSSLEEFSTIILQKSASKFNKKIIEDIISLIAVSRNGLRESDIAYILSKEGKYKKQEFIQYINYMSVCFILKEDGRYDFSHEVIKNSIKNNMQNSKKYEKLILDRIKNLDFSDELRLYDGMYHAYNVGDKSFVVNQMELACIEEEDKILVISNTIKQICYLDEGKWLCNIVKDRKTVSDKSVIIPYLLHDFREVFEDNDIDNCIRMNLMTELVIRIKKIYKEDRCIPNQLNLVTSYKRMGDLCCSMGELSKAVECYKACIKNSLEIYKYERNSISFGEIMIIYGTLGDVFMKQKDISQATKYYKIFLGSSLKRYKNYHSLSNLKAVGSAYKRMGNILKETAKYEPAKEAFDRYIKCMKKISEADKDDIIFKKEEMLGYYLMGEMSILLGEPSEALKNYDEALKCSKKINAVSSNISTQKDIAVSYALVGNVYASMGKLEEALMYQEKNLRHIEKIYEKLKDLSSLKELSVSCSKTAEAYLRLEEYDSALEYYKQSLNYSKEINTKQNDIWTLHDIALAQEMVGYVYGEQELYYEALEYYNVALSYKEECLYMQNNITIVQSISLSCDKIAFLYDKLDELEKAIEFYERELSYEEEIYAVNNAIETLKAVVFCYSKLGIIYTRKCEYDKAVSYYQNELDFMEVINEHEESVENVSELAICYGSLGEIYYERKNIERALYYYQNELTNMEQVFIYQNEVYILQGIADKCERIGDMYTMLGRHETALEYYKRELLYTAEIYDMEPDINVIKNMTICCNILAQSCERLDILEDALNYYKKEVECGSKICESVDMQDINEMIYLANEKIETLERCLQ